MSASTKIRPAAVAARMTAPIGAGVGAAKSAAKTAAIMTPRARKIAADASHTIAPAASTVATFATERVIPAAAELAERIQERIAEDVIPAVTAAVESAYEASEPMREEAARRGTAAITGWRQPELLRPRRRWPLALLTMIIGAAIGAAAAIAIRRDDAAGAFAPETWETTPATAAPAAGGEATDSGQVLDLNANEKRAEESSN